jgi:DNA-binding transcriptional MerR regulator
MEDKNTEKRYRIGDFARFMGVSPDFLKLYEEAGLLRVEQRRSGYRYYPFHDSARVLEYMKLRNYGVRIRDMEALLLDEEDNVLGELDRKADEMRRSVERTEILIDAHDRFRRWAEARRRRPIDWEIKELEPAFFLFHSNSQDFIDDDRIYEIVRDWSSWLPAVKSAMYVTSIASDADRAANWGLAVSESFFKRCGLPANGAVVRLPMSKCFIYHFAGLKGAFSLEDITAGRHPAFIALRRLGFTPAGNGLLIRELQLAGVHGEKQRDYGRFIIPIAD